MTYLQIVKKSNTTGVTSGAGICYPSGEPAFITNVWRSMCRYRYLL